jgi:acyl-CoA reductase-like NAD-dependent aldehyde dehydrogenase
MGALKRTLEDKAEDIAQERHSRFLGDLPYKERQEIMREAAEQVEQNLERLMQLQAELRCFDPRHGTPCYPDRCQACHEECNPKYWERVK